jgi:hypothetical protein
MRAALLMGEDQGFEGSSGDASSPDHGTAFGKDNSEFTSESALRANRGSQRPLSGRVP